MAEPVTVALAVIDSITTAPALDALASARAVVRSRVRAIEREWAMKAE